MKAIYVLSHNAVLLKSKEGKRYVATGKGIGFKKEVGDRISPNNIQNIFIEDQNFQNKRNE